MGVGHRVTSIARPRGWEKMVSVVARFASAPPKKKLGAQIIEIILPPPLSPKLDSPNLTSTTPNTAPHLEPDIPYLQIVVQLLQ